MGHPLRMYEPNVVYEVTIRTIQSRYLLRPSEKCNEIIIGVIGRACELYPSVRIHGVQVLSTHFTWLVSAADPEQIARFFGFVNGEVSFRVGRLHDWPGKMWGRRIRPLAVLGEAAQIARLEHLLAQGTKENLVESPRQWPGVNSARALLDGKPLRGTWFHMDAYTNARERGEKVTPYDFSIDYEVHLDKLPCWEHLSDAEHRKCIEGLVRRIERSATAARQGRRVVGVRRILATDPHFRPDNEDESPAPPCHASSPREKEVYMSKYETFVAIFRRAAMRLRAGALDTLFPPYSFPPGRPFVQSTA